MKVFWVLILFAYRLGAIEINLINRNGQEQVFIAGDLLSARLEVNLDSEEQKEENFFAFLEKNEIGPFSIIGHEKPVVKNLSVSIDMDIILRDEVQSEGKLFYLYKGIKIPIQMRGFRYKFIGLNPKLSILSLKLNEDKSYRWLLFPFLVVLLLFIGCFFAYKIHGKNKDLKMKKIEHKKEVIALFSNVKSRKLLEVIYEKREIWENFVESNDREDFFSVLNKYRYKKNWESSELEEVCLVAEKIKAKINA